MNILGIRKSSWHYKILSTLYKLWNIDNGEPDFKSLCAYSQAFFWLCVVTCISTIPAICGWVILKIMRLFYKYSPKRLTFFLDKNLYVGESIDTLSQEYNKSPIRGSLLTLAITFVISATIFLVVLMLYFGVYNCIEHANQIPHMLFNGVLWVGWAFSHVFLFIGVMLQLCFDVSAFLISVSYVWLSVNIFSIMKWAGVFAGSTVLFSAFLYTLLKISETQFGQNLIEFISFKYNGYQTAREESKKIQEEIRCKKIQEPHKPSFFEVMRDKIEKFLHNYITSGKVQEKVCNGKKMKLNVLGTIPMIWQTFKSIFKGICPMIEIIDDEE